MQIRDDEQALLFPEQRAGEIGGKSHVADGNCGHAHVVDIFRNLRANRHVLPASIHRLFDELIGGFGQKLVCSFAIN